MLRDSLTRLHQSGMATGAEVGLVGEQQFGAAGMGLMTGCALTECHGCVQHWQSRSITYIRMALSTEDVFVGNQHPWTPGTVGAVTVSAIALGWRMNHCLPAIGRIVVTPGANLSLGRGKQIREVTLVTAMTLGAITQDRMG